MMAWYCSHTPPQSVGPDNPVLYYFSCGYSSAGNRVPRGRTGSFLLVLSLVYAAIAA